MTYASADPGLRDVGGGVGKDAADGWAHENGVSSWVVFQIFLEFSSPKFGEAEPILTNIFVNWVTTTK